MDKPMPPLIDLNRAEAETLAGLPGIGPARAARIVAFRAANPFAEAIEIVAVSGISEKMYRQFADRVTVSPSEIASPVVAITEPDPSAAESAEDVVELKPQEPVEPVPRVEPLPTAVSPPPSSSFGRRAFSAVLLVVAGALIGAMLALLVLQSINGTLDMALHPEVLGLHDELSTLQQQSQLQAGELHALRERLNQMEALSGRLQSAEADISALDTALSTVDAELDSLQGDTAQIKESVNEIQQATSRFGGFLDGLRELLLTIDETPATQATASPPVPKNSTTATVTITPTGSPSPTPTVTPRPTRTATPPPK